MRDQIICELGNGNIRIVLDSRTEGRTESYDRAWRRWNSFCRDIFRLESSNLDGVPAEEVDLIARAFLEMYRGANFCPTTGKIVGKRKKPMVGQTIKEVTRALGKTLWDNFEFSPFHKKGDRNNEMTPNITDLLSGMESISPSTQYQKAITPDLL